MNRKHVPHRLHAFVMFKEATCVGCTAPDVETDVKRTGYQLFRETNEKLKRNHGPEPLPGRRSYVPEHKTRTD